LRGKKNIYIFVFDGEGSKVAEQLEKYNKCLHLFVFDEEGSKVAEQLRMKAAFQLKHRHLPP
jgi:hypothetical protein